MDELRVRRSEQQQQEVLCGPLSGTQRGLNVVDSDQACAQPPQDLQPERGVHRALDVSRCHGRGMLCFGEDESQASAPQIVQASECPRYERSGHTTVPKAFGYEKKRQQPTAALGIIFERDAACYLAPRLGYDEFKTVRHVVTGRERIFPYLFRLSF